MQVNATFATITSVNTSNRTAQVKLDNGQVSSKNYKYPKNTIPSIEDRCFIVNNAIVAIY